jgi:hypothetical protein
MNDAGTNIVNSVGVDAKQILKWSEMTCSLFGCIVVVLHSIFSICMGLRYLTFVGRNLENEKKPMPIQIINSAWYKYCE